MCGVVGYVGNPGAGPAAPLLIDGLRRLEYRGYDSAGVAVAEGGQLTVLKVAGRVADLQAEVSARAPTGSIGVAHTRWATHGRPSRRNAHPHLDAAGRVAVVHNGIIENAEDLRAKLVADGVEMASDTDTEVVAQLIGAALAAGVTDLQQAVVSALEQVEGAYGLVVLDRCTPDRLVAARNGSPLVVVPSARGTVIASDPAAVTGATGAAPAITYLDDGDVVTVTATGIASRARVGPGTDDRASVSVLAGLDTGDDGPGVWDTFMRKEIHDQPRALERVLAGRLDRRFATARFGGIGMDAAQLRQIRRVKILGCGSAYYAGQLGAMTIEELARIPADAEPAAEFRYRNPVVDPRTLYIAVSQSGETADTLLAVQELLRRGATVLGVVNVVGSAIARATGRGIFIHAGPEYAVASTKAFTNMAATFVMLGLLLGRVRDLSSAAGGAVVDGLQQLPAAVAATLTLEDEIAAVAARYATAPSMYFVGRHRGHPVAREGAQKMKEISYVHAESYPASELKHGPLALVNESLPTVVVVPDDELLSKNLATIDQIHSRGGRVLVVTDADLPAGTADDLVRVPATRPQLAPIVLGVALQMFACHAATVLHRDVDKPRNLAKSVTVE